jgi:dipeptide/tripeptide permease
VAEFWTLVIMSTPITDSRRCLLRRLFFVCETLLVGSFCVIDLLFRFYYTHNHRPGDPRFGAFFYFSFLGSFAAILILGFLLRRTDRTLAIIGWASAFGLFLYGSLSGS